MERRKYFSVEIQIEVEGWEICRLEDRKEERMKRQKRKKNEGIW